MVNAASGLAVMGAVSTVSDTVVIVLLYFLLLKTTTVSKPLIEQGAFFCDMVLLYLMKKGSSYRERKYEAIRYRHVRHNEQSVTIN